MGDSVKTLTQGYEVISGVVTGIALPYDPRVGYGGVAPDTPPTGNPKAEYTPTQEEIDRPPGRLFTVFSVQVSDPGSSNLKVGEVINLGQTGGIWEGKEYQMQSYPLLEVGKQYILTITADDTIDKLAGQGYLAGPPFTVFRFDGDKIHSIDDAWSDMPAVKAIAGQSAGTAMSTILQARAELAAEATVAPR